MIHPILKLGHITLGQEDLNKLLKNLDFPNDQIYGRLLKTRVSLITRCVDKSISSSVELDNNFLNNCPQEFVPRMKLIVDSIVKFTKKMVLYIRSDRSTFFKERITSSLLQLDEGCRIPELNMILTNNFVDFKNVQLEIDKDNETFFVNENNSRTRFGKSASGFQHLIYILSEIMLNPPSVLLIDEPEISMHPRLIFDLLEYLRKMSEIQIIVASHNDTLMNYFSENEILYVYQQGLNTSNVTKMEASNFEEALKDLGIPLNPAKKSLLLSSHLTIVTEDKSDNERIRKLFRRIGLDDSFYPFRVSYEYTAGNKIIDLKVIDKINNFTLPILIVRDGDEWSQENKEIKINDSQGRVFFWSRREIENFALSVDSIFQCITKGKYLDQKSKDEITEEIKRSIKSAYQNLINKVIIMKMYNSMKSDLSKSGDKFKSFLDNSDHKDSFKLIDDFGKFLDDLNLQKSVLNLRFQKEKQEYEDRIKTEDDILRILPGKDLISFLNRSLGKYKVGLNFDLLIEHSFNLDSDIRSLYYKIYQMCDEEFVDSTEFFIKNSEKDFVKYVHSIPIITGNHHHVPYVLSNKSKVMYLSGSLKSLNQSSYGNQITRYDYSQRKVHNYTFEQDLNIHSLDLDEKGNFLILTASTYHKVDDILFAADSVYTLNIETEEFDHLITFSDTQEEGKEGGLADIKIDQDKQVFYICSVYAMGGDQALYMLKYSVQDKALVITERKREEIRREGPLGLQISTVSDKLYVISQGRGSKNLVIYDKQLNEKEGLDLETSFGTSQYEGHRIKIDEKSKVLFILTPRGLLKIELASKTFYRVFKFIKEVEFFEIDPDRGRIYLISSELDEEQDRPYYQRLTIASYDETILDKVDFHNQHRIVQMKIHTDGSGLILTSKQSPQYNENDVYNLSFLDLK